jgi:photosystem II stability/assembly factor-like uncharacterized protein
MGRPLLLGILLAGGLALGTSAASTAQPSPQASGGVVVYQEDFQDGQAQGWQLEDGWAVVQDGDASFLSGEGHVWARVDQALSSNFRLTFRLRLVQGRIHLVVRSNEVGRYYLGLENQGSDLNRQEWPDTFHSRWAASSRKHSLNAWHAVEIVETHGRLELIVDGQSEFSFADPAPLTGGTFAFETLDDGAAQVDDIVLYDLEEAEPSATATPRPATATAQPAAAGLDWVRTGGPLGGLGYDIRMRPDNPDIMFVTDAKTGVYKSTDGGKTWVPKNNGITTRVGPASDEIPVFCLTIDPSNYDTLWAGTQYARGFFKSTDNGESWTKMVSGVLERGMTTRGFAVDPHNSDVVYAAGEISSWEWAGKQINGRAFDLTKGVVYKTLDGGKSWKKVWQGDNVARYVWIDPRDTNVLYVSTGIFDREAANSDVLAGVHGGVGVIKSTDGGKTWTQINNGIKNLYVGSLFMHPTDPDTLLAGTGNAWGSPGAGVYLTTDGGQSWQQTLTVDLMIESVEFSTANPQIAFAGGFNGVYRSEDGGRTWTSLGQSQVGWGSPGIMAGHPFDFQVDPRNPDRIFSNQYSGGNFLSLDGGTTWEPASKGYTGAAVRDIAADPTQPGAVIVAARSGIFASYNGGEDWMGLSFRPFFFPDWHVVAVDPSNPQHIISGLTCWRSLVASSNSGASWHKVREISDSVNKAFTDVVFAPSNPKTVYAASAGFISCGQFTSDVPSSGFNTSVKMPGSGVFVSHDGGEAWEQSPDPQMQDLAIGRLAVDPENPGIVFAATFYHGLLRSSDGGQSWDQVQGGLPANRSITTVSIDPRDGSHIFAGLSQGGLYRSTDGGTSWRQVVAGLPAEGVMTDVEFDVQDPMVLYASEVFSGVYRSQDGGKTWQTINSGMGVRSINALALSTDGKHLYAASEGSGVYRLDLNGQAPSPAPVPQQLSTATPSSPLPTPGVSTTLAPSVPTTAASESAGKPGTCPGAAAIPLAVLGTVWWNASRRRAGR